MSGAGNHGAGAGAGAAARVQVVANHVGASRIQYNSPQVTIAAEGRSLKGVVSEAEWQVRCDLAAAYRVVASLGWTDSINNHLTAKVPGTEDHFLINNFGEGFNEVTASSLVKIDANGTLVLEGSRGARINEAGFVIHSAMHGQGAARGGTNGYAKAEAVFHTHEANVTAVSCDKRGIMPLNQTALLCGVVSYHDFEGVALDTAERERLLRDIQPRSQILMLRNHGVLTWGPSIAQAFMMLYYVHKAAEVQVKVVAAGDHHIHHVDPKVQQHVLETQAFGPHHKEPKGVEAYARATFELAKRDLDHCGLGGYAV